MVALPFMPQPAHWVTPDGDEPARSGSAAPAGRLLS
jgi:hypothetical protein